MELKKRIKNTIVDSLVNFEEPFDIDQVTERILTEVHRPPIPQFSRTYYITDTIYFSDGYGSYSEEKRIVIPYDQRRKATLVGSKQPNGTHAPVIDIDYEARLLPSSTPGHYHLYLDKETSWRAFKRLLRAMYKAGLIDKGFYYMSKGRKQAFVRTPWFKKDD